MLFIQQATQLKETADKLGAYYVLQNLCPGKTIAFPYFKRMGNLPIDEMNLSVRSINALKRYGAFTTGKVAELIGNNELKAIRNLGTKSEKEIIRNFFILCYEHMTCEEQLCFWQTISEQ